MARIVFVNDDPQLALQLAPRLEQREHTVVPTRCTEFQISQALQRPTDLVIVNFAGMGAKAAFGCQRILARLDVDTSVLALFSRLTDEEYLEVLTNMADDLARKRTGPQVRSARGEYGFMTVDVQRREVIIRGKRISLTPTETHILSILAASAGHYVEPKTLVAHTHGYEADPREAADIIRVHIHNLRRKLGQADEGPPYIVSCRGRGYMLERRGSPGRRASDETAQA